MRSDFSFNKNNNNPQDVLVTSGVTPGCSTKASEDDLKQ